MAILETETIIENRAVSSRFFISPECRPSHLVTGLIANLGDISIRSKLAQAELRDVITDEIQADYIKMLAELAAGRGNEDTKQLVGYMDGISTEASQYSDAVATIRHAGMDLAERLRKSSGQVMKWINSRPYWVAADYYGRLQFCGQTDDGEGIVIFGVVTNPRRETGQEAGLEDYIRLITDIQTELAASST